MNVSFENYSISKITIQKWNIYFLHIDNISKIEQINKLTSFDQVQRSDMYDEKFNNWFLKVLNIIHEEIEGQYKILMRIFYYLKLQIKYFLVKNSLSSNSKYC